MPVNNGVRVLSISDCFKHTYKNGYNDNPSVKERLVFWQLKTGDRITLLKLSCKFTTHSEQFSTCLNSPSQLCAFREHITNATNQEALTLLAYTLTCGLISLARSDTSN